MLCTWAMGTSCPCWPDPRRGYEPISAAAAQESRILSPDMDGRQPLLSPNNQSTSVRRKATNRPLFRADSPSEPKPKHAEPIEAATTATKPPPFQSDRSMEPKPKRTEVIEAATTVAAPVTTAAEPAAASRLRAELTPMRLRDLLCRARHSGIQASKLDVVMEQDKPKEAVLSLIVDHVTAPPPPLPPDARCIEAARTGEVGAVQEALAQGADLGAMNAGGMTALMVVAAAGQMQILRILVAAIPGCGRQPNGRGGSSPSELLDAWAPPTLAVGNGARGLGTGNVGWFTGATALLFAARWGHAEAAFELLRAGASVAGARVAGGIPPRALPTATPLHVAAFHGHSMTVAVLLQHGADTERRFQNLKAEEWAAKCGHTAVLKMFTTHQQKTSAPGESIASGKLSLGLGA